MTDDETSRPQGLGLLSSLMQKPKLENIWYNRKQVSLDGYCFLSCRFDNCTLIIASSNFELHNCFLDDYSRISYKGDIVRIIRLFNSRYSWYYENLPYFAPTRNDDGTISIV